jgi:A/G-specific adenine glycosylase
MELGALVCTAARPACASCPVAPSCAWRRAGSPASSDSRRGSQAYDGTDRQCRGRLLAVLREAAGPVAGPRLDAAWPDPLQRGRALDSLVADGLIDPLPDGRFALPGHGDPGQGDPGPGDPGQQDPGQQESLAGNVFPARLPRS